MSHFVVMVIGENIEQQLAPFDENMEVPEYAVGEVSEDDKRAVIEYYAKGHDKTFEEVYAKHGASWNGGRYRKDENGVWMEYSTYNPKAKWDWWTLGGRWSGMMKVKPGATDTVTGNPGVFDNEVGIDQCRKKDLDLEAIRAEKRAEAEERYSKFRAVVKDHPWPEAWDTVLARYGEDRIEEARAFYHAQSAIKALKEARMLFVSPEEYGQDQEAYVANQVADAFVPFALLMNGQWYEKGKMGWWAVVRDKKDQPVWRDEFWKMFDALPDDTLISMVDCHI